MEFAVLMKIILMNLSVNNQMDYAFLQKIIFDLNPIYVIGMNA